MRIELCAAASEAVCNEQDEGAECTVRNAAEWCRIVQNVGRLAVAGAAAYQSCDSSAVSPDPLGATQPVRSSPPALSCAWSLRGVESGYALQKEVRAQT